MQKHMLCGCKQEKCFPLVVRSKPSNLMLASVFGGIRTIAQATLYYSTDKKNQAPIV